MNELNKTFGRDFIIGFFLPALAFLLTTSWCWAHADQPLAWLQLNPSEPFKETAVLVMIALALAILLQALNRELFRMLEGYWPLPVRDALSRHQKKRFRELQSKVASLKAERDKLASGASFPRRAELRRLSERAAARFPSREDLVLPTAFGNTARAYEDYPRVMYGFESIGGWARIQTVMSEQAIELLSRARARVDLWLNLFFLTWVLVLENYFLAIRSDKLELLILTAGSVAFAIIAYYRARSSAERYGDQVKAAYDVYLPELCSKLGYRLSAKPETNRTFWRAFSRAFVHRQPERISEMARAGLEMIGPKVPSPAPATEKEKPQQTAQPESSPKITEPAGGKNECHQAPPA